MARAERGVVELKEGRESWMLLYVYGTKCVYSFCPPAYGISLKRSNLMIRETNKKKEL